MRRSLVLRRESLTELGPSDLAAVAAGTSVPGCVDPGTALASLRIEECVNLSVLHCYSWHTEEC